MRPELIHNLRSIGSIAAATLFAITLNGCSDAETSSSTSSSSPANIVALVGPDAVIDPAELGSAKVADIPIFDRFPAAAAADTLIVPVASNGMRSLDKEQLFLAGLLQPSTTIVVLTDSGTFGDYVADDNFDSAAGLAEKAEKIRAAGKTYGVNNLVIATDSVEAEGEFAIKGWAAVLAEASKATPHGAPGRQPSTSAEVVITIPRGVDSHAPHALKPIKNGDKVNVVFASGYSKVVVELDETITSGGSGPAELMLEDSQELAVGEKFIITRMGSVIGSGEIQQL